MDDLMRMLQLAGVTGIDKAGYTEYVEEKKADKDYDEDGEIEDTDDEWKGSRDNAIKDEQCDESAEEELDEEEEVIDEEEEPSIDSDLDVEDEINEMVRLAGLNEAPEWSDHFDNDREAGGEMDFAPDNGDEGGAEEFGFDMDSFAAGDNVASEGGTMVFNNYADAIEASEELDGYNIPAEMVDSREGQYRLKIDAPQDVINDIAQKWEGATVEGCEGPISDTQPSMGGPMGGGEEMVIIQLDGPEDMMMGEGMGDLDLIAQDIANELTHLLRSEPEADAFRAVQELVQSNPEVPDEMKAQVAEIALDYYEGGIDESAMGDLDFVAQSIANEIYNILKQDPNADVHAMAQEMAHGRPDVPPEMAEQVAMMAIEHIGAYDEDDYGMEEAAGDEAWGPDDIGYVQGQQEPEQPEWDGNFGDVPGDPEAMIDPALPVEPESDSLAAFDPAELISQIGMMQDSGMSAANAMYDPERMLQMPIDQIVSIHKKVMGGQVDEEDDNWAGDPGYQTDQPGGHVPYDPVDLFPSGQATNAIHRVSNTAGGHSDNPMATVDPVTRESSEIQAEPIYNKLKESWDNYNAPSSKSAFKRQEMDRELGHEKNGPPIKLAIKVPFKDKDTVKQAAQQAGVRLGWHKAQKTWFVQVPPTEDILAAISKLEKASGVKLR